MLLREQIVALNTAKCNHQCYRKAAFRIDRVDLLSGEALTKDPDNSEKELLK
jgi:hypothetical protein